MDIMAHGTPRVKPDGPDLRPYLLTVGIPGKPAPSAMGGSAVGKPKTIAGASPLLSPTPVAPKPGQWHGRFFCVPNVIRTAINHDPAIKPASRGDVARLVDLMAEKARDGVVILSAPAIAEEMEVCERTARRLVAATVKAGYLLGIMANGRSTVFRLPWVFDDGYLLAKDRQAKEWEKARRIARQAAEKTADGKSKRSPNAEQQPLTHQSGVTPDSPVRGGGDSPVRGKAIDPGLTSQGSSPQTFTNNGVSSPSETEERRDWGEKEVAPPDSSSTGKANSRSGKGQSLEATVEAWTAATIEAERVKSGGLSAQVIRDVAARTARQAGAKGDPPGYFLATAPMKLDDARAGKGDFAASRPDGSVNSPRPTRGPIVLPTFMPTEESRARFRDIKKAGAGLGRRSRS